MGDLLIRNIPDSLKKKLAESAERSGLSLSDEAKEILRRGMVAENIGAKPMQRSAYDDLSRTFADVSMTDQEHADFMAAIDESRLKELGRSSFSFE